MLYQYEVGKWKEIRKRRNPIPGRFYAISVITREITKGGNELINDEVRRNIEAARQEVIFCGQWLPDGITLSALIEAAKRGVQVQVFTNFPPLNRQPVYSLLRYSLAKKLAKYANMYGNISFKVPDSTDKFFHIKALLTDPNDVKNATALTGNDNMTNETLQRLGLRDITVGLNSHPHKMNLYNYVRKNVISGSQEFDLNRVSLRKMFLDSFVRLNNN